MMKKRFSILTLTLLFLVSTTGLPIWSHYCEMIGKKSLSECGDCKIEEVEISACCSETVPEDQLKYSIANSTCCIDEFDYKKIEDDFFQTITSNLIPITSVITELQLSSLDSQSENKFSEQTNYNLPPPKFGKELLNIIHQLKLDLPVC
ncbi:MAG: hypothetical protein U5J96_09570 [Ignavibacteriaceae bacterium]|nr:hypothetical protein [Ignavibacteriaceae bacterium]